MKVAPVLEAQVLVTPVLEAQVLVTPVLVTPVLPATNTIVASTGATSR